jgi:galactose mutarotase-like enzyme
MIYSISKNNYAIEVNTHGAELISLKKNGINYLWTKAAPWWQRHAPVLFPIVGKLKNNKYFYEGKEYSLLQHGFARDSEFELTEEKKDFCLFRLLDNRQSGYPFQFDFFIQYSIEDNAVVTSYIIENKGDEIMPFSVGAHPGFTCPFHSGETLDDYYFEFDNDDILNRIPLKEGLLEDKAESVFLEKGKLKISEELFKNDALVLSGFKSKSIKLISENYELKVSWKDCSFLGLWKQPNAPFVCIEPWWGVTDRIDHNQYINDKKGIRFLDPGESKKFQFAISVS